MRANGSHRYEFVGTEWLNPQGDSVIILSAKAVLVELLRLYCRFDSYRRRSFLAVMKIVSLPLFSCRIAILVTNLSAKQGWKYWFCQRGWKPVLYYGSQLDERNLPERDVVRTKCVGNHRTLSNSLPPRVLWVRSLLLLPADAFFRYCPGVQPLCWRNCLQKCSTLL